MPKDEIRNKLFKTGSALSPDYKKIENLKVQKKFLETIDLRKFKNILLYRNIKNEIPTNFIMLEASKLNIDIYFPVVAKRNRLLFKKHLEGNLFKKNRYGIEEPIGSEIINPMDLSLVVIPFVGVDRDGFRLGNGGGYYDRIFGSLSSGVYNCCDLIGCIFQVEPLIGMPLPLQLTPGAELSKSA